MSVIGGMIIGSLASALAIAAIVDGASARAVVAGMTGPLVSACATWIMIDRTLRANPGALTQRLLSGFLVKAVLFPGYVFVAVKVLGLPVTPFALSFTAYFIVLHQTAAVLLRQRSARASHLS
jgi:hypothetical protein